MPLPGKATATATSILDWFKPLRSEAVARLRTNSVGLVGLAILSNLLPVPSLWRAFDVVWQRRPVTAPYYYLCAVGAWNSHVLPSIFSDGAAAELLLLGVFALNVLQASYALKYPRAPLPPPPSPATPAKTPLSPPSRQWRLQGLTPTVRALSDLSAPSLVYSSVCLAVEPSAAKDVLHIRPLPCLDTFPHHHLLYPSILPRRVLPVVSLFGSGLAVVSTSGIPGSA